MRPVSFKMIAIFICLMLTAAGCSMHRSGIKDPVIELPSSYSRTKEGQAFQKARWWEQFDDEHLNLLMQEAFSNNLDIARTYERLRQSQAVMRATGSGMWPQVNIEGSGGRARQSGALGPVTSDTYSLSAAASYEIDLWAKLASNTKAARLDALASEQDLKAAYISVSAQLADLYYLAVEQRAQIELSSRTILSLEDTLDRVERRYRAGLVSSVDVYQSRQNLASARAQRTLFEKDLAVTLNSISVLIGRFPDGEKGGITSELRGAPELSPGMPSELLVNRPDIRSAFLRLKASDKRIAAAVADRFPSFNLAGTYGGASDDTKTMLDSPNIFWNILLQAAQPLFEAGRRKAEVDRTKAVFREHLAAYHKAVLTAFQEVEDALALENSAEKRLEVLGETVSASENELRIALSNYLQGLTDYLPVLTAQQRSYEAGSSLLTAKRQLISARIQLARALGGKWADKVMRENLTVKK